MHEFWTHIQQLLVPLLVSTGLGMIIGLERQLGHKPAGLRTHVLVCLGSTVLLLISQYAKANIGGPNFDPTRTIQGIITGVGFIGGGSIMREKSGIHGITTAATIFMAATIGIAVGVYDYPLAVLCTVLALIVLVGGRFLDRRLPARDDENGHS